MKKIISFLILLTVLCTAASAASPLYTKTVKETVTGGVSRTNIQKFYGDYSLNINLITADLKNSNLSLSLLKKDAGCDKVDTVMNLANGEEGVVAATNADFFSYYKGDQNFSLGLEIKDGELLQSHINPDMAAGFFKDGVLDFSYLQFSGTVTAPNGASSALTHINKPTDYYGAVLMYTPEFNGGVSPFLPNGITAVTVVENTVTAKGISLGGTIPIPENGYILVIDDVMTPFLEHNFNIGDAVKVTLSTAQLTDGVDTAFGGGTLLVKDGKKAKITHQVAGNHPRTAIGTNADGTEVYLLTVDGRQSISRGVSLDELADICLEAGMVNAMNLDGGGSTAMVAKTLSDEEIHYINSPSEKRKVINAVAVTSTAQKGETAGFIASAESRYVLSGDSVKLNLTPYDANYNKPTGTPYSHEWKVAEGSGYIKDDVYYASGSGKTILDLYYNGQKSTSVTVNVIDNVCGINAPGEIELAKGKEVPLSEIEVFDSYGNTAKVNDVSLLNPACDSFISLTGNKITAISEGAGAINLYYGNVQKNIKVVCGNYDVYVSDANTNDTLKRDETGGTTFNILGFEKADTLLDRLVYKKGMELFSNGNISAVLGGEILGEFTPSSISPITAKSWKEYNYDNLKIISISLNSGGIMARGDRWKDLSSALKGGTQKNVFILLDKEPGFSHTLDSYAFSSMLEEAAKVKNVFVIYNGSENFCSIKNGVRYITLSDSKDLPRVKDTVENVKYLSFNVTKDGATYCFKNLYPSGERNSGIIIE